MHADLPRDDELQARQPDTLVGKLREVGRALGIADGGRARLSTKRASVTVTVAVDDAMAAGHLALPNGLGIDHPEGDHRVQTGVAPNELTSSEDRDPWVGTPWHKSVAARLEVVRPGLK